LQHRQETQEKKVMTKELANEVASLKRELESLGDVLLEQLTVETTSHLETTVNQNESLYLQQQEQQKMKLESLKDERSHLQHVLGAYTTHLNQLSDAQHNNSKQLFNKPHNKSSPYCRPHPLPPQHHDQTQNIINSLPP